MVVVVVVVVVIVVVVVVAVVVVVVLSRTILHDTHCLDSEQSLLKHILPRTSSLVFYSPLLTN